MRVSVGGAVINFRKRIQIFLEITKNSNAIRIGYVIIASRIACNK